MDFLILPMFLYVIGMAIWVFTELKKQDRKE
jgi:hypothetical protein